MVLVCLVILIFLFHVRSALVVAITMPLSVLISMIPLYYLEISLNIMSMGGIILAIGDIVDGVVVFIENSHKKISESGNSRSRTELVTEACQELGPSVFSALLIISVSFLPIFALQAQEGRLFHPSLHKDFCNDCSSIGIDYSNSSTNSLFSEGPNPV